PRRAFAGANARTKAASFETQYVQRGKTKLASAKPVHGGGAFFWGWKATPPKRRAPGAGPGSRSRSDANSRSAAARVSRKRSPPHASMRAAAPRPAYAHSTLGLRAPAPDPTASSQNIRSPSSGKARNVSTETRGAGRVKRQIASPASMHASHEE